MKRGHTISGLRRSRAERRRLVLILTAAILGLAALAVGIRAALVHWRLLPGRSYTAKDFGIETLRSTVDFNGNGIDDYTDILLGARRDAENKPEYDSRYWEGGYPPDEFGVCTDVVWRAFRNAGYALRDMVDADIRDNLGLYPRVAGKRDANIDFRRVPNLKVFFERHALSLTTDTSRIEEWQPGDIVTWGETHIGIVSDKRNADGIPYVIHNGGQPLREEDALLACGTISGHFRFDAGRIDASLLIPFA